jgi:metal transporter CNNM
VSGDVNSGESQTKAGFGHRLQLWIEAPIAWPVAKLLDWLLGESHGTMYRKIELKTLVGLHGRKSGRCLDACAADFASWADTGGDSLSEDEVTIISAVLECAATNCATVREGCAKLTSVLSSASPINLSRLL